MSCARIFLFSCIDSALGRVDKDSLPHQALLELFVGGIENKETLGKKYASNSFSEWKNVQMNHRNEVLHIYWGSFELLGSINLEWLPSTLQKLLLAGNSLTGTLDLTELPHSMIFLELSSNRFTGSVDLCHLPETIEHLSLFDNLLSGSIDLTCLPNRLQKLFLNNNDFSGSTDFSQLPSSLNELSVTKTRLSGKIVMEYGRYFYATSSDVKIVRNKN